MQVRVLFLPVGKGDGDGKDKINVHNLAATLDKVAFSELQHELLVKPYTINNFDTNLSYGN